LKDGVRRLEWKKIVLPHGFLVDVWLTELSVSCVLRATNWRFVVFLCFIFRIARNLHHYTECFIGKLGFGVAGLSVGGTDAVTVRELIGIASKHKNVSVLLNGFVASRVARRTSPVESNILNDLWIALSKACVANKLLQRNASSIGKCVCSFKVGRDGLSNIALRELGSDHELIINKRTARRRRSLEGLAREWSWARTQLRGSAWH